MEVAFPVLVEGPSPSALWKVRSLWETAAVAHFLGIFRSFLHIAQGFTVKIEDVEASFCDSNSLLLAELHVKLLRALLHRDNITYNIAIDSVVSSGLHSDLKTAVWQDVLKNVLTAASTERGEGYNPLADLPYHEIDIVDRVKVAHLLCDLLLADETLLAYVEAQDMDADSMRGRVIGVDNRNIVYWYFGDHRLYREIPVVDAAKVRRPPTPKPKVGVRASSRTSSRCGSKATTDSKRMGEDSSDESGSTIANSNSPSGPIDFSTARCETISRPHTLWNKKYQWESICVSSADWEALEAYLSKIKGANTVELHRVLNEELLPAVLAPLQAHERDVERQKLFDAMPRKRSNRIQRRELQSHEDERVMFLKKEEERLLKTMEQKARKQREQKDQEIKQARHKAQEAQAEKDATLRLKEEHQRERQRRIEEREQRILDREVQLAEERELELSQKLQREERLRHRKDRSLQSGQRPSPQDKDTIDGNEGKSPKSPDTVKGRNDGLQDIDVTKSAQKRKARRNARHDTSTSSETDDVNTHRALSTYEAKRPRKSVCTKVEGSESPSQPRMFYVFSSTLANMATNAVKEGKCKSMIDYHKEMQREARLCAQTNISEPVEHKKVRPQQRSTKLPKKLKKQEVWIPPMSKPPIHKERPQPVVVQEPRSNSNSNGSEKVKRELPATSDSVAASQQARNPHAHALTAAYSGPITNPVATPSPETWDGGHIAPRQPQMNAYESGLMHRLTQNSYLHKATVTNAGPSEAHHTSLDRPQSQPQQISQGYYNQSHPHMHERQQPCSQQQQQNAPIYNTVQHIPRQLSPHRQGNTTAYQGQVPTMQPMKSSQQQQNWDLAMLQEAADRVDNMQQLRYNTMKGQSDASRHTTLNLQMPDMQPSQTVPQPQWQHQYDMNSNSHRPSVPQAQSTSYGLDGVNYQAHQLSNYNMQPQYDSHLQTGSDHAMNSQQTQSSMWSVPSHVDSANAYLQSHQTMNNHPLSYSRQPTSWGPSVSIPAHMHSTNTATSWDMTPDMGGMDSKDIQLVNQLSQMRHMP